MPSPRVEVQDGSGSWQSTTAGGAIVTPGNVITVRLVESADVWTLACISTDETSDAAVINADLVVDPVTKTATFTAPAAGKALIFRSQINRGLSQDRARADYTATFGIYTLATNGRRVAAMNETFEGNTAFGWTSLLNGLLRSASALGSSSTADQVSVTFRGLAVPFNAIWVGGSYFRATDGTAGTHATWLNVGASIELSTAATIGSAAVNGHLVPDFSAANVNTSFYSLNEGNKVTFDTYSSRTAGTMFALFRADTAAADPGGADSGNNSPQVFGAGACGIAFNTSGVLGWMWRDDSTFPTVTAVAATSVWHLAIVRWDGSSLAMRLDNGSWNSVAAGTMTSVGNDGFAVGSYNVAFDGQIAAFGLSKAAISDDDAQALHDALNAWTGSLIGV